MLAHWNNSPRKDMSLHSDTVFCSRSKQSLLLLLHTACLGEKQQIPILQSLARTHDLPHLRRARYPLHHWCGSGTEWNSYKNQVGCYISLRICWICVFRFPLRCLQTSLGLIGVNCYDALCEWSYHIVVDVTYLDSTLYHRIYSCLVSIYVWHHTLGHYRRPT